MRGALPSREVHQPSGILDSPPFPLPIDPQQPTLGYNAKVKYTCKKCGRDDWRSSSALARHEQSHRTKNEKPHHCVHCGKSFSQKTALITHTNIHTGARPHICRQGCNQTFSDPSSRTRHEKELHSPEFGFKCIRPGCNESFKRKSMFATHMVNAHTWPKEMGIPPSVYDAAKSRCATDYAEFVKRKTPKVDIADLESEMFKDNDTDEEKPLFNGKRPRSNSTSSDDHLNLPPAKKQAYDPSLSRRNAVCAIEIQTSQGFTPPRFGHERNDSDDCSNSTGSSLPEALSGAYQPTYYGFTTSSPPDPPLNSAADYHDAIFRVSNRPQPHFQNASMQVSMHSGAGGYTVAPASVSPRAPVAMPEPLSYPYPVSSTGGFTRTSWPTENGSYSSQWALGNEVAQTPHAVNPVRMEHEGLPARGVLPLNNSSPFLDTRDNGLRLYPSEQQAEHSRGSFRGHQDLTRSPSEHSNSSRSDPHMSRGEFELTGSSYGYFPDHGPQVVPRSVIGPSSHHKRSNN